jgi:hypothetical protein
MNEFFNPTLTQPNKIEVKVHENDYDYTYKIKAIVSGYDEVKEIDAFVKKYMPGHYLTTREIIEREEEGETDDEERG